MDNCILYIQSNIGYISFMKKEQKRATGQVRIYLETRKMLKVLAAEREMSLAEIIDFLVKRA